jgi:hypothetical protein
MPRPRFTEDVEFRTGLDSNDNLVRRPRFIQRPRVINGRTVPGNAAYYRRREAELRAARRQQRAALAGARSAAPSYPWCRTNSKQCHPCWKKRR